MTPRWNVITISLEIYEILEKRIGIKWRLTSSYWPSQLRPCRPSLSSLQSLLILQASYISSFSFSSSFSPANTEISADRTRVWFGWSHSNSSITQVRATDQLAVIYTGRWRPVVFPAQCWSLRRSPGHGWRNRRWALSCKDTIKSVYWSTKCN